MTWIYCSQFRSLEVLDYGQPGHALVRALIPVADSQLLTVSSHGRKRARELSRVPFVRALIPFTRTPLSWLNHLPKASPPNTITLSIRISTNQFRGWEGEGHSVHCNILSEKDGYITLSCTAWTWTSICKTEHISPHPVMDCQLRTDN